MGLLRFFRRKKWDEERARELDAYLESETTDNIARGMSPTDARDAARRKLGNMTQIREEIYHMNSLGFLETFAQDVRFALRMLRKNPGFTAVAVLTLALGIGANTAIFSVVDETLIRPLPYHDPGRIVFILERPAKSAARTKAQLLPLIDTDRRFPRVLAQVASVSPTSSTLTGVSQPEILSGVKVSSEYFSVLGWEPALGRDFVASDEAPGATPVVILSDTLWRTHFSADPSIIGRTIVLDNMAHTVIGVMPAEFKNAIYDNPQMWMPQPLADRQWIARLAPQATIAAAKSALDTAELTLPGHGAGWQSSVDDLRSTLVGDSRADLLILFACSAFVLSVACTNISNLLLARDSSRRLEIQVRAALGAGRWRIARQMLTESIVLGVIGGAAGLGIAFLLVRAMAGYLPLRFGSNYVVETDARMFWFAGGVAIFTAILFGVLPALRSSRANVAGSLKEGTASGATTGMRHSKALGALIICEVALALVLTVGASLLVRGFLRLRPDHPGFDPVGKLAVMMTPAQWKYPTPELKHAFVDQVIDRIHALPGVNGVAAADYLPFSGMVRIARVYVQPGSPGVNANARAVSPNYFDLMNVPLLKGRTFQVGDRANGQKVAIVSRRMADTLWAHENPLGMHFTADYIDGEMEIIGVVDDTRESGSNLKVGWPDYYVPIAQSKYFVATLVVSTNGRPAGFASAVRDAVLSVDRDQPLTRVEAIDEMLSMSVATQRFNAYLVGAFAGVSLLLAAVGIFGVISFSTKQRSRELGIRIALGANGARILRLVLATTMIPVFAGVAIGWGASLGLAKYMSSVLYGLKATDATANVSAIAVLCAVALVASLIPAFRALKIDPARVLRCE
jgi:predicted permease